MKHCIIGDVHGEYTALLNLVATMSKETDLIFVGDLIDRGAKSAHVIRYIRQNKLRCVRGNHEEMMITYGSRFVDAIENNEPIEQSNVWLKNGGIETLLSYDLVSLKESKIVPHPFIKEFIFQFKEDIMWMSQLPLYLELPEALHPSERLVVVSHCSIASVWHMRDNPEHEKIFKEKVLWSRLNSLDQEPTIFNVFGHTPQKYNVNLQDHYVNVDTGCCMKNEEGLGLLSAYCVESGEVYSSGEIEYQLTA